MKAKIVAGNWKMNTSPNEGVELAKSIQNYIEKNDIGNTKIILAPPYTHINQVVSVVDYKKISVAAQNCCNKEKGAYTGEISASMIAYSGAHYIIIGHSERRQIYGETNSLLNEKVSICLKNALRPIYCCGETLEERDNETMFDVVKAQISEGLFHLTADEFKHVVVAYEPVWAIGTGRTASPEQASEMHVFIRGLIADKYGLAIADDTMILYGGSVNAANAKELFSMPGVDGGLVGGASLKTDDFISIINAAYSR